MRLGIVLIAALGMNFGICASSHDIIDLDVEALHVRTNFEPLQDTWEAFKKAFGRNYTSSDEEAYRKKVFLDNVKTITDHNINFVKGLTTYWLKITDFSDTTHDEYLQSLNCYVYDEKSNGTSLGYRGTKGKFSCSLYQPPKKKQPPKVLDYRSTGPVTSVKDQKKCGSCWAFATVGTVEGQYYKKYKKQESFSVQQLIDCSKKFGNKGCKGGNPEYSYSYIKDVGGIQREDTYPYTMKDGKCKFNSKQPNTSIRGCMKIKSGSEDDLQSALSVIGPLAVGIDASPSQFNNYAGGYFFEPKCSKTKLSHAMLVVGYKYIQYKKKLMNVWIVKNSYGSKWGDRGYIYMARNRNNNCGIASDASVPII